MPLEIEIPDDDLRGFSDEAQRHLKEKTVEYVTNLIEEANRLEAGRNSTGGPPEVTRAMVNDATVVIRRGLGVPKIKWGVRLLRIASAVLSLCVGFLYNENRLQNGAYLLLFIIVVAAAILTVTIATLKE